MHEVKVLFNGTWLQSHTHVIPHVQFANKVKLLGMICGQEFLDSW